MQVTKRYSNNTVQVLFACKRCGKNVFVEGKLQQVKDIFANELCSKCVEKDLDEM